MIPIKRENAERDGIIGWDWQQPDALRVLAAEFAESSTRAHTVANIHNPASDSGKLEIAIARAEARTWAAAQAAVNRVLLAPTEVGTTPETPGSWEQRCAALYQVLGCLANAAGIFETSDDVANALDVACGRGDVENLLPWPKDVEMMRALQRRNDMNNSTEGKT